MVGGVSEVKMAGQLNVFELTHVENSSYEISLTDRPDQ